MTICDYCGSELRDDDGALCPVCGAAVHKSCYSMHWSADHPDREMRDPLRWPPVIRSKSNKIDNGAMILGGILLGTIGMMISSIYLVIFGVAAIFIGACAAQGRLSLT
ncbi:MAG: RING finger protein [Candidatus Thorarchaeota archaeon]